MHLAGSVDARDGFDGFGEGTHVVLGSETEKKAVSTNGRANRPDSGSMKENPILDRMSFVEKNWAGGVHIAALFLALCTHWFAGAGGMLAGFVVWFLKREESPLIRSHATEAFNFNLSMCIYVCVGLFFVLSTLGLGVILYLPVALVFSICWIWCTLRAAFAGFDGREYRYPITLRILR
jgi:uncharacterized Tic20 family protein